MTERPKILLVIPTYEPEYLHDPDLEAAYVRNFDSFLEADGAHDFVLAVSDFGSSRPFKNFLAGYVGARAGTFLVSSPTTASVSVAFNVALGKFAYDYAVYAASDVRARDRTWLATLLQDFEHPSIQVVTPTVTFDGLAVYEQTQPAALDRPSRQLIFPECFNLHCAVFGSSLLRSFDNRYPDIFDTNFTEYCLMYAVAAMGGVMKLNFRVNMIHEHVPRRHHRMSSASWRIKNGLYEADRLKFEARRLLLPHASLTDLAPLMTRVRKHFGWMRQQGWRYVLFRSRSREMFENFCSLDRETRIAIARALFYRPVADYDRWMHGVQSMHPAIEGLIPDGASPRADV